MAQCPKRPSGSELTGILGKLGAGGKGIVYLAEQEKPIHRRVALKIIKLSMDTRQMIARFGTELEALTVRRMRKMLALGSAWLGLATLVLAAAMIFFDRLSTMPRLFGGLLRFSRLYLLGGTRALGPPKGCSDDPAVAAQRLQAKVGIVLGVIAAAIAYVLAIFAQRLLGRA